MSREKNKQQQIFSGKVVSAKMKKTLVAKVVTLKKHEKYLKRYRVSRKYKVHDEREQFKEGERVRFVGCRPLSKEKRWRVLYG